MGICLAQFQQQEAETRTGTVRPTPPWHHMHLAILVSFLEFSLTGHRPSETLQIFITSLLVLWDRATVACLLSFAGFSSSWASADSAEILLQSCQSIRKSPNAQPKDWTIWPCHSPPSTVITLISDSEHLWRIGTRSSPALIAGENSKRWDADQAAGNSSTVLWTHWWIPSAPPHWKIVSFWRKESRRIKPLVITGIRSPHYFKGKDFTLLHITAPKLHAYLIVQKEVRKPKGTLKTLSSSSLPVLKMQHFMASLSDPSSFSSVNMTRVHRESLWQQTCISYILWPPPAINPCQDGWHESALVLPQNNMKKKVQLAAAVQ